MPATETTEAVSRSVTELGSRVGLTPQEFNVGLWLAGLLGGEPGAWHCTEQGKRFATVHSHHNGYGGHAARFWDTTSWPETVIDKLDLSEANIARIRQFIAGRKLAQQVELKAGRAAADAAFLASQAAKNAADAAPDVAGATRTRVIVGIGVAVTLYGLHKARPRVRRWWKERAGAPDPARDRSDRSAPPENLT